VAWFTEYGLNPVGRAHGVEGKPGQEKQWNIREDDNEEALTTGVREEPGVVEAGIDGSAGFPPQGSMVRSLSLVRAIGSNRVTCACASDVASSAISDSAQVDLNFALTKLNVRMSSGVSDGFPVNHKTCKTMLILRPPNEAISRFHHQAFQQSGPEADALLFCKIKPQ